MNQNPEQKDPELTAPQFSVPPSLQYQFNRRKYFSSFTPAIIWKLILAVGLVYLIYKTFKQAIDQYIVGEIVSKFPESSITDFFVISLIAYTTIRVRKNLAISARPTINSIVIALTIFGTYVGFVLTAGTHYRFYSFSVFPLTWLRYSDVFVICSTILFLDYKPFFSARPITNEKTLVEDNADPKSYRDIYSRGDYAKDVCQYIKTTNTKSSFSIAVIGEWGSGKTDFLKRLGEELKDSCEVIEYFPWKIGGIDNIVQDFFSTLSKTLKKYNHSIAAQLRNYSKKLFQPSKELSQRTVDVVVNTFFKEDTLNEQYDSLKDAIGSIGKKLIVFIDDIDRLTGEEAIEVLRLIRNTANFPNTIYIVALDHEYLVATLRKTNLLSNEERYLRKIFQLVITLPVIRKIDILEELKIQLKQDFYSDLQKAEIDRAIAVLSFDPETPIFSDADSREYILEETLDNIRDVKRFVNSFRISFNRLEGEVEVVDLFLIELIRLLNIRAYNLLTSKYFFTWDIKQQSGKYFVLNEDAWKKFEEDSKLERDVRQLHTLKLLIEVLLSTKGKSTRMVADPKNFSLYFSYQLFDLMSYRKFNELYTKDFPELFAGLNDLMASEKRDSLVNILESYSGFTSLVELRKYIVVLLRYNLNHNVLGLLLHNRDKTISDYFYNESSLYQRFLNELLNDGNVTLLQRARLAHEFLVAVINRQIDIVFSKQEWQQKIFSLFKTRLDTTDDYTNELDEFICLNDDRRISDRMMILNPVVFPVIRRFLEAKPHRKEQFFKKLIRNRSSPPGLLSFVFYAKYIFGGAENLKGEVERLESKDEKMNKLKGIILENFDKEYSGNAEFAYNANDERYDFIMEHLRDEGLLSPNEYEFAKAKIFRYSDFDGEM